MSGFSNSNDFNNRIRNNDPKRTELYQGMNAYNAAYNAYNRPNGFYVADNGVAYGGSQDALAHNLGVIGRGFYDKAMTRRNDGIFQGQNVQGFENFAVNGKHYNDAQAAELMKNGITPDTYTKALMDQSIQGNLPQGVQFTQNGRNIFANLNQASVGSNPKWQAMREGITKMGKPTSEWTTMTEAAHQGSQVVNGANEAAQIANGVNDVTNAAKVTTALTNATQGAEGAVEAANAVANGANAAKLGTAGTVGLITAGLDLATKGKFSQNVLGAIMQPAFKLFRKW